MKTQLAPFAVVAGREAVDGRQCASFPVCEGYERKGPPDEDCSDHSPS